MASIKVKYRPSTTNGKEGSIYYQIIHGRTVRQIGTDFRVFDTEWDKEASSVKIMPETNENRKQYLYSVSERIGWDIRRLQAIIAQCDRQGGSYSAYNIVEKFNCHANGLSLFGFMQDHKSVEAARQGTHIGNLHRSLSQFYEVPRGAGHSSV